MICINGRYISTPMYENFRACAIENTVWYDKDGRLASWDAAFHGLGFKSYEYVSVSGRIGHQLDNTEYTWFLLRFS